MTSRYKVIAQGRYLELVKQFPLVTIKSEAEYDRAVVFLKKLALRDEATLDAGEAAYLDALTLFVEDYEQKHHRIETEEMTPLEALKYLMAEGGLKPVDLGRILGNRSLASQVLKGNRELSKANIVAMAKYFHVEAGVFLGGE